MAPKPGLIIDCKNIRVCCVYRGGHIREKNHQLCIVSKTYESLKLKTLTVDYSKQSNCTYGLYERHGSIGVCLVPVWSYFSDMIYSLSPIKLNFISEK